MSLVTCCFFCLSGIKRLAEMTIKSFIPFSEFAIIGKIE